MSLVKTYTPDTNTILMSMHTSVINTALDNVSMRTLGS